MHFIEITDINDDLLLPWLALYETAFPPEERELVSSLLVDLKARGQGQPSDVHIIAVMNDDDSFIGLACYEVLKKHSAAIFWYLAVKGECRGQGTGALIYTEIADRARESGVQAMILEVEIPEDQPCEERRLIADRRLGFYRRLGARLLEGICYMMTVGPHQPPMPFHIMIHQFSDVTPQQAFDMVRSVFDDLVSQVGELRLTE